jgi:hypothetical protein
MLSGDGPRTMQSHLLQHFSESENLRVIVFTTVNVSSEDVTPCAPNLNDSALELLQALQAQRQEEQEGKARKGSETPEGTTVEVNGLTVPFLFDALDPLPDCVHRHLGNLD